MNLVIVLRHGETNANRERKLLGQEDPPLNARGIAESELAADWVAGFTGAAIEVLSSPKLRAVGTAEIIASRVGAASLRKEPRLLERRLGIFDHEERDNLERMRIQAGHAFRDVTQDWAGVEGVEQDAEVAARALSCVDLSPDVQQIVVLVTHAGVAKSVFHELFAVSPSRQGVLKIRNGGALALSFRHDCVAFEALFNPRVAS